MIYLSLSNPNGLHLLSLMPFKFLTVLTNQLSLLIEEQTSQWFVTASKLSSHSLHLSTQFWSNQ
tara:strand:- start:264 stop:455 length:192 start_codon:yes stop_codon:yes gene_type:complete